jgi:hypothetical protein
LEAFTIIFTVPGGHWKAETSFLRRVTGRISRFIEASTKNNQKFYKKKTVALRQKVLF